MRILIDREGRMLCGICHGQLAVGRYARRLFIQCKKNKDHIVLNKEGMKVVVLTALTEEGEGEN